MTSCSLVRRRQLLLFATAVVLSVLATADAKKQQKTKDDLRKLSEVNSMDIVGMVLMAVGLAAASAGGVGGGAIIVPLLIAFMGFDIKFATPTSNFTIMGGAVANAIFNLRKRHPFVERPLVDADICMAMIPSLMGGAVIGAFLSKLFPSYVTSTLLVVVLAISGIRTMQKGIKLHVVELDRKRRQMQGAANIETPGSRGNAINASDSPSAPVGASFQELKSPVSEVQVDIQENVDDTCVQHREQKVQELLDRESKFNWKKHGFVVFCYVGILAATIGGAQIECGSVGYWVLLWAEIPWVLLFTCFFVVVMRREQAYKRALDFPTVAGDLNWTHRTVMLFPMACMFAGVVAGLFGVGGAIITGPLMIEMGVLPEVASSSSAMLVLYSSAAASAKFAMFDMIAYDWSGLLCALGFVVTIISQVYIGGFVRRTGRQSIIVFCIGVTTCLGCLLMIYSTVETYINNVGEPFKVEFCPNTTPRVH